MDLRSHYVVFLLDRYRFALPVEHVERILRAVQVSHVPKAPDVVEGFINVQGRIIPVVNLRRQFYLPEKPIEIRDQFILARSERRTIAIVVDYVSNIVTRPESMIVPTEELLSGLPYIQAVAKTEEGMILILSLENILSADDRVNLEEIVEAVARMSVGGEFNETLAADQPGQVDS
ncbi:MAG: chemotaxis protein CheW [Solirubrobacterales bacterium]